MEYTCLNLVLNLHCRDENTLFVYAEENARGLLCQNEPDHPVNRLFIYHTHLQHLFDGKHAVSRTRYGTWIEKSKQGEFQILKI